MGERGYGDLPRPYRLNSHFKVKTFQIALILLLTIRLALSFFSEVLFYFIFKSSGIHTFKNKCSVLWVVVSMAELASLILILRQIFGQYKTYPF